MNNLEKEEALVATGILGGTGIDAISGGDTGLRAGRPAPRTPIRGPDGVRSTGNDD